MNDGFLKQEINMDWRRKVLLLGDYVHMKELMFQNQLGVAGLEVGQHPVGSHLEAQGGHPVELGGSWSGGPGGRQGGSHCRFWNENISSK